MMLDTDYLNLERIVFDTINQIYPLSVNKLYILEVTEDSKRPIRSQRMVHGFGSAE